jgi:hypothetical protein
MATELTEATRAELAAIEHIELPDGFRWGITPGGIVACLDPNGDVYNTIQGGVESAELTARMARKGYWFPKADKFRDW